MNRKLGNLSISQEILERSRMGLWAFEIDEGKAPRMYANDVMMSLLGLKETISPEETFKAWYDNVDPSCIGLIKEAVDKMSAGVPAEVQYPWRHPDGHTVIVSCQGLRNPQYDHGIRIEGCHQDISDMVVFTSESIRKRKILEMDYQTIRGLANEYDVLHIVNLDSAEFIPFYIENEGGIDTGFTLDDSNDFFKVFERSIKESTHPEDLQKMLKYTSKDHLKRILSKKPRQAERIRVKDKYGGFIWMDFVLVRLDNSKQAPSRIGVGYINVDEQMRTFVQERERLAKMEKDIEEERRAKELETERYNFLINMTHEIKTPLTLILGPIKKIESTEALSEKGLKSVARVRQQANKMNTLLETVLTSNRVEDGFESPTALPVNFNDWVNRSVENFRKETEGEDLPIIMQMDQRVGIVQLDEHLCDIVMSNMLINAIRNNSTGNKIHLSTQLTEDGQRVRVSIMNNGQSPRKTDKQENSIDDLYKASEDKTGFGIGLFYSKKIISTHNGRIGADNVNGKVSTYWFELPLERMY